MLFFLIFFFKAVVLSNSWIRGGTNNIQFSYGSDIHNVIFLFIFLYIVFFNLADVLYKNSTSQVSSTSNCTWCCVTT